MMMMMMMMMAIRESRNKGTNWHTHAAPISKKLKTGRSVRSKFCLQVNHFRIAELTRVDCPESSCS
jgi:hypothetical protein